MHRESRWKNSSSKGCLGRTLLEHWLLIGGEVGKGRHLGFEVFGDWSRGGEKEAMFAQIWVVSIMSIYGHRKPEAEVKRAEAEVKMSNCFIW